MTFEEFSKLNNLTADVTDTSQDVRLYSEEELSELSKLMEVLNK